MFYRIVSENAHFVSGFELFDIIPFLCMLTGNTGCSINKWFNFFSHFLRLLVSVHFFTYTQFFFWYDKWRSAFVSFYFISHEVLRNSTSTAVFFDACSNDASADRWRWNHWIGGRDATLTATTCWRDAQTAEYFFDVFCMTPSVVHVGNIDAVRVFEPV